jgi:outer membrane protein assembly factor BamB
VLSDSIAGGFNVRTLAASLCLVILGCGIQAGSTTTEAADGEKDAPVKSRELPEDLWTRKTGDDWPRFLGPQGISVSTEKGIITPWPAKGLRVVWHKQTSVGYGMPAISRGRLFLFDRRKNFGRLLCLKAETGEFLWKFEYPTDYIDKYGYDEGPRCSPVVDGDRVYILGAEGKLHCLAVADGKQLWKVDVKTEFGVVQNYFGVGSTPVIEKDLLIVQVGGSPKGSDDESFIDLKGNGSGVVAFDKYTGKVRYKITDELASYSSPVLATIGERRWCFVFARGGLIGFDPATGKVDFHFPWRSNKVESVNASNPVVVGDRVFVSECYSTGGSLLKVKPGGYDVLWKEGERTREKKLACHWMTPIFHDGFLYGSSGRHTEEAELRCIEMETGKVAWSENGLTRSSLLMVDGHFICLGEDGTLRLLKVNTKKYEEVSHLIVRDPDNTADDAPPLLKQPCWAAPILAHGLLYVRGHDQLVCLELIPEKK